MPTSRRSLVVIVLMLAMSAYPALPQLQPAEPAKAAAKNKPHRAPAGKKAQVKAKPIPQTIRVGNTDMELTDIVPRTEAAQSRLQQAIGRTKDPTLRNLQQSLATLTSRTEKAREETLYVVRNARSTEQITEARIPWQRDRRQLETLSVAVQSYIQVLMGEQRQISAIQQAWSLAERSTEEPSFPEGLQQRIEQVQEMAAAADAGVRSTLESLVQLQVQISDERKILDDLLQQIDVADEELHRSVFILDGPPLWSALRGRQYASLKEQARITMMAGRSRTISFYHTYPKRLLVYFVIFLALIAVFHYLRRDLERRPPQAELEALRILRRPLSLAAFTVLLFFGAFFPKAPPEVFRMLGFVSVFPAMRIALAVFERDLRLSVLALSLLYALDAGTGHMAAGTLLRRLLVFFLTVTSMAGLTWVLRKSSVVHLLFRQKRWGAAELFLRFALVCLTASVIANLLGGVSLADLLTHGTLRTGYIAMAVYVTYQVLRGLISLFTATKPGQAFRVVRLHRELVLGQTDRVLKLLCWITWLMAGLVSYQVMPATWAAFQSVWRYKWTLGTTAISIGDICLFFLVLLVASAIARAIRFFLEEEILPRTRISTSVAQSSSRLVHYTLVMVGFVLAFAAAGLDLNRLTLLTGAVGVGLGFGLQNLVGNFVSGIILSLERPMQVGDVIEVGSIEGDVTAIGFRSTTVRTSDGSEVIVPNSELVSKPFVNWSLTDRRRRSELRVGVDYSVDPARVLTILTAIVNSHPTVLKHPQPSVTFERFGESALEFCVRFWSSLEQVDDVRSDLNVLIAEELTKHGILVALSQREVHLHMDDGDREGAGRTAANTQAHTNKPVTTGG